MKKNLLKHKYFSDFMRIYKSYDISQVIHNYIEID